MAVPVMRLVDPFGVLPRAGDAAGRLTVSALDRLLSSPHASEAAQIVVDRLLAEGIAEQVTQRVLDGPEIERLAAAILESPSMERLVAQVLESELLDAVVARLLVSEELWIIVDEVARSPSVTEAISHQGIGFADQVAVEVGRRSRRADARLERAARRLLHRAPGPGVTDAP
jgi:hypothetical protein